MELIGQKRVEQIALEFLKQYHDACTIESSALENEMWVITAKIGLVKQQIRKILIDALSGQILSYSDRDLSDDEYGIRQTQVAIAIERALMKIGLPAYEKTVSKLYESYHCRLFDCYEHPQYLLDVLRQMFGENYKTVTDLIKSNLNDSANERSVMTFLTAILR